jgi:hypothetical protein
MRWVCLQIHQPCWWRQLVSVRLRYAGSPPDIYSHPATETVKPLQSVGIRSVLRKDSICSADFEFSFSYPTGDPITGWVKIPDLGRARKTLCCYFGSSYLSQNWHLLFLMENQPPRNDHCPPRSAKH